MSHFLRSLIRSEAKSCEGKIKYPFLPSAERSATAMMVKKPGEVFESYDCTFCGGFHIGHRTNFNWIPASHADHELMICSYLCGNSECQFEFFTNTVFSTRIISHFPDILTATEAHVHCPKCRKAPFPKKRKMINLAEIDPATEESLKSLFERDIGKFVTGPRYS